MAIEYVEYRPGKWVKVVDGRIIGRAKPEEIAAWQAGTRASDEVTAATLDLDLDIDLSPRMPAGPAHALDVPLRPAFERRRRAAASPGTSTRAEQAGEASAPPQAASNSARASRSAGEERVSEAPTARATPGAPGVRAASAPQSKPGTGAIKRTPARRDPSGRAPQTALGEELHGGQAWPASAEHGTSTEPTHAARPAPEGAAQADVQRQEPGFWWVWNMQGQPVEAFLQEWVPKYRARFGHEVSVILCHEDDLAAVVACGYHGEASPLLQPGHFYLGHGTE